MFIAKLQNGTCGQFRPVRKQAVSTPTAVPGATFSISAPVGFRGRNLYPDVVEVQSALVRIGPARGGQPQSFSVDGSCGSKTVEAIRLFQVKHFGWSAADGLIEPGKRTHQRFNEIFAAEANAVKDFRPAIALAQRWIAAAQANCIAATPFLNAPSATSPFESLNAGARLRLLNKHFQLDKGPNRPQRFRVILNVFDRMRQVFIQGGGMWGPAIFERDPADTDPPVIAFTTIGGFFRGGETVVDAGITFRSDSIFLCPLFARLANDQERAFTLVHELAHFVGHPEKIVDHAYNMETRAMELLLPIFRNTNADSYANFASEAFSGMNAVTI